MRLRRALADEQLFGDVLCVSAPNEEREHFGFPWGELEALGRRLTQVVQARIGGLVHVHEGEHLITRRFGLDIERQEEERRQYESGDKRERYDYPGDIAYLQRKRHEPQSQPDRESHVGVKLSAG